MAMAVSKARGTVLVITRSNLPSPSPTRRARSTPLLREMGLRNVAVRVAANFEGAHDVLTSHVLSNELAGGYALLVTRYIVLDFNDGQSIQARIIRLDFDIGSREILARDLRHGIAVIRADLEQDDAVEMRDARRVAQQAAHQIESVRPADEGHLRFVAANRFRQIGPIFVVDVGQIGGEQIDRFGDGFEQAAHAKVDARCRRRCAARFRARVRARQATDRWR